jgi:hypothetical protein
VHDLVGHLKGNNHRMDVKEAADLAREHNMPRPKGTRLNDQSWAASEPKIRELYELVDPSFPLPDSRRQASALNEHDVVYEELKQHDPTELESLLLN